MFKKILILTTLGFINSAFAQNGIIKNQIDKVELSFAITKILTDSHGYVFLDEKQAGSLNAIASGDINNDGLIDIVKSNMPPSRMGVNVFLNEGNNKQFKTLPLIKTSNNTAIYNNGLLLTDIDADGKLDLIVSTRTKLAVRVGLGDGEFGNVKLTGKGSSHVEHILPLDYDKDGKKDLVVIVNSRRHDVAISEISLQKGDGFGGFEVKQKFTVNSNLMFAALNDQGSSIQLAVGGLRGKHSGRSGTLIYDVTEHGIRAETQISDKAPSVVQVGNEENQFLVIEDNNKLLIVKDTLIKNLDELPRLKFGMYIDVKLVRAKGDLRLVVLENSGVSKLKAYEIK